MYKIYIYEDTPCREEYYRNPSSDIATETHLYNTAEKMQQGWAELLEKYEGETYGVWDDDTLITGGAFDPDDISYIDEYLKELEQGKEPEPDEITMRLSHLAGMLESRGEITCSEWDDMSKAIKDAENAYYNDVRFTTASSLEEVAERIFKERFPVSPDKTAGIPNTSIKKAEQILVDNGIEHDEAATVLQALGYALLDKELYPKMETFYFTYGTDKGFPFQGGWTEIHAADRKQAVALFRREHPDRSPGLVNCSSIYTEKQFQDKVLPLYKDGDAFWSVCHECITPEGVTYPIKENRPDMDMLLKEFNAAYDRLYNNAFITSEETSASNVFDNKIKSDPWYKCLVQDFVKARQDFISSDREAAAFEIALQTCLQRQQQQRKPDLESQMKAAGERAGTQQPMTPARNDLTK